MTGPCQGRTRGGAFGLFGSIAFLAAIALAVAPAVVAEAQATLPATADETGAAALYLRAARMITVNSPGATVLTYGAYPPFPDAQWLADAKAAWDANGRVRDLARQARSVEAASWPQGEGLRYLGLCRSLAVNLGDAALYEDFRGDHAGAVERVRDMLHLGDLVQRHSSDINRLMTGMGIGALACNDLMVIASGAAVTSDAADSRGLRIATAHNLIGELLDQRDPKARLVEILGPEGSPNWINPSRVFGAFQIILAPEWSNPTKRAYMVLETLNRCKMEADFAAVSLACHVFKHENRRWPDSLDQLVPTYLSRVPVDPWGDGRQALGYVVIRGGLPDGSDRPMVFSRCLSRDGLFYRIDTAQYGFYEGDGSDWPPDHQIQGGQFRDIARWTWAGHGPADSTPRPLLQ